MRRSLKIIAFLLVIAVIAAVTVPFVVPMDTLKEKALSKVEAMTGRKVRIGAISLSVFPDIALNAKDVKIGNPGWAGADDMADIKQLRIGVELLPLLHKQVHIKSFTLEEPVITLIKNGEQANWQFEKPPAAPAAQNAETDTASQAMNVAIPGLITIKGGRLTYRDMATQAVQDISDIDFDFKAPEPEKQASLSFSATINGQKVLVTLTLGNPLGLTHGSTSDTDLKLSFGPVAFSWQGTLAFMGTTPSLTGIISIPKIDAAAFKKAKEKEISFSGAAPPAQVQSSHWSDAPLNLKWLSSINADLTVKVGELILQKTTLKDIEAKLSLAKAVLTVSTNDIAAYGGTVKLALALNNAGSLSVAGALSNVDAQPLLRDFAQYEKLSGTLAGKLSLTTSGMSERAMVSKLAGTGVFQMKNGKWQGRNILAMARNIGKAFGGQSDETTNFAECSGTFAIKDGVISNNDLILVLPQLRASGQGNVDLPGWQIQYLLSPKLVLDSSQKDASGIVVPIRIEGSLDNPSYHPDLNAALKENLKNPQAVKDTLKSLRKNLLDNGNLGGLLR